jgi:hypothetical protein
MYGGARTGDLGSLSGSGERAALPRLIAWRQKPAREKVPDHLHRHALVKKMLRRRMPQRMGSPLPGDNAERSQAVADDFP